MEKETGPKNPGLGLRERFRFTRISKAVRPLLAALIAFGYSLPMFEKSHAQTEEPPFLPSAPTDTFPDQPTDEVAGVRFEVPLPGSGEVEAAPEETILGEAESEIVASPEEEVTPLPEDLEQPEKNTPYDQTIGNLEKDHVVFNVIGKSFKLEALNWEAIVEAAKTLDPESKFEIFLYDDINMVPDPEGPTKYNPYINYSTNKVLGGAEVSKRIIRMNYKNMWEYHVSVPRNLKPEQKQFYIDLLLSAIARFFYSKDDVIMFWPNREFPEFVMDLAPTVFKRENVTSAVKFASFEEISGK